MSEMPGFGPGGTGNQFVPGRIGPALSGAQFPIAPGLAGGWLPFHWSFVDSHRDSVSTQVQLEFCVVREHAFTRPLHWIVHLVGAADKGAARARCIGDSGMANSL